ncbi:Os11g0125100 [Oryza sativa Japonica Group]|uniref:Uncharacterized protein n=2 Tax=Oryza sativa subsp. japonica TaxID=39947 RepID=A0A8J8Y8I4_ORYSJ|nr:hypothetical protein OsJ_32776 [Oryza sativa Japonica Group]BAT12475.1 Os11g0125100 [Oryza sativa Japonica Group]
MPNIKPNPEVVIESSRTNQKREEEASPPKSLAMEKELDGESTCAAPCEKKRLIPSCFEWGTVPATKKMKTEEDLEVLLAYPSLGEGKKKKKVVVKRLGKEEVERLLL